MKRRICSLVLAAVIAFSAAGCNQKGDTLNDGYYTARMSDYSHGWMEFVTICVSDGHLVSIEYNAKGPSGYLKSWDIPYMRTMGGLNGTYPLTSRFYKPHWATRLTVCMQDTRLAGIA